MVRFSLKSCLDRVKGKVKVNVNVKVKGKVQVEVEVNNQKSKLKLKLKEFTLNQYRTEGSNQMIARNSWFNIFSHQNAYNS